MSWSCKFGVSCLIWSTIAGALLAGPRPATFQLPRDFEAGKDPAAAAIADFNHDGKPDVAVADKKTGDVSILLNTGNGFARPVRYRAGTEALSIVTADFNGDGNADLAVVGYPYSIYVLLGNGDGSFQPANAIPLPSKPSVIIAGDFNGDGRVDLALAAESVLVLLGSGDGTFGSPIVSTIRGKNAVSLAAGDFENDGRLDLAVTTFQPDNLYTLRGNGDGTFQPAQTVFSRRASPHLLVADFNGDGNADILDDTTVLLGNGDGTFHGGGPVTTLSTPAWVTAADINGDGKLDILTANSGSTFSVCLGNGDGTFQPDTDYLVTGPRWIGTGDFLGHGRNDVIVLDRGVSLIPAQPGGSLRAEVIMNLSPSEQDALPQKPLLADFNGDGNLDAAVIGPGTIFILLGNGDGTFRQIASVVAGPLSVALLALDFNGDGKPDLAVADGQNHTLYILQGNGDGTFSAGATYAIQPNCGEFPSYCYAVATADLDHDGKADLVVLGGEPDGFTASAQAFLGNGDGTFGAPLNIASDLNVRQFSVGDFNGDGYPDLVFNRNNNVEILLGNGDGTFQSPTVIYAGGSSNSIAADFNGDGKLDLAFSDSQSQLVIALGNGDGTFRQIQAIPQFNGVPTVADFNGDGKLDLLTNNTEGAGYGLYTGKGDGTCAVNPRPLPCATQGGWGCAAAVGDLNGDGLPDIFSIGQFLPLVSTLINTTQP